MREPQISKLQHVQNQYDKLYSNMSSLKTMFFNFSSSKYRFYIPFVTLAIVGLIMALASDVWKKHDAEIISLSPFTIESKKDYQYYQPDDYVISQTSKVKDIIPIWHKDWKTSGYSMKSKNNVVPYLGLTLFGLGGLFIGILLVHDVQLYIKYDRFPAVTTLTPTPKHENV
jgi:hypothetical protein